MQQASFYVKGNEIKNESGVVNEYVVTIYHGKTRIGGGSAMFFPKDPKTLRLYMWHGLSFGSLEFFKQYGQKRTVGQETVTRLVHWGKRRGAKKIYCSNGFMNAKGRLAFERDIIVGWFSKRGEILKVPAPLPIKLKPEPKPAAKPKQHPKPKLVRKRPK